MIRAPEQSDPTVVGLEASACLTALGDDFTTWKALCENRSGLRFVPVDGQSDGEPVPLALRSPMLPGLPQRWRQDLQQLAKLADNYGRWGEPNFPVIFTSSNFSIESLHAFKVANKNSDHLPWGSIPQCIEFLRTEFGWGNETFILSHACVSSALALRLGARLLQANEAEKVLVFSFDYLSPFVTSGFHSLKILNNELPKPYQEREAGSLGLGDGAGFAVLTNQKTPLRISNQVSWNEMFHLTGNQPDGSGFSKITESLTSALGGRRAWIRGHGAGTLEAGRLECEAWEQTLPEAPLVSWKGGIGHTLGSCGVVELALAATSLQEGKAPGTVGSTGPFFAGQVSQNAIDLRDFDAAILTSNAFGGAHTGLILSHD